MKLSGTGGHPVEGPDAVSRAGDLDGGHLRTQLPVAENELTHAYEGRRTRRLPVRPPHRSMVAGTQHRQR